MRWRTTPGLLLLVLAAFPAGATDRFLVKEGRAIRVTLRDFTDLDGKLVTPLSVTFKINDLKTGYFLYGPVTLIPSAPTVYFDISEYSQRIVSPNAGKYEDHIGTSVWTFSPDGLTVFSGADDLILSVENLPFVSIPTHTPTPSPTVTPSPTPT